MDFDLSKIDAVAGGLTKSELYNEALFALGGQYSYLGLTIPSPSAGNFMLLEIIGSPYLIGGEITDKDVDRALFVILMGKEAVGGVFEDRLFDVDLDDRVTDCIESIPNYQRGVIKVFLDTYFKYSMHGFDMLPKGESESKEMTFDADWLASYISICNEITGYDMDKIVWEMPVIMGGFCTARYSKESGAKGIDRRRDDKAILKEIKRQADEQIRLMDNV